MVKKKATFFDKIEKMNDGGVIKLTDEDRNAFVEGSWNALEKAKVSKENYIWFILGITLGILGSLIANFLHDFIMSLEILQRSLLIIGIILLFFMVCFILYITYKDKKEEVEMSEEMIQKWKRAKSITVGPRMKPIKI